VTYVKLDSHHNSHLRPLCQLQASTLPLLSLSFCPTTSHYEPHNNNNGAQCWKNVVVTKVSQMYPYIPIKLCGQNLKKIVSNRQAGTWNPKWACLLYSQGRMSDEKSLHTFSMFLCFFFCDNILRIIKFSCQTELLFLRNVETYCLGARTYTFGSKIPKRKWKLAYHFFTAFFKNLNIAFNWE